MDHRNIFKNKSNIYSGAENLIVFRENVSPYDISVKIFLHRLMFVSD